MLCARKESLLRLCDVYTSKYTQAVDRLRGISPKIAKDDWNLAWQLAERARKHSLEMLSKLRHHRQEHGC